MSVTYQMTQTDFAGDENEGVLANTGKFDHSDYKPNGEGHTKFLKYPNILTRIAEVGGTAGTSTFTLRQKVGPATWGSVGWMCTITEPRAAGDYQFNLTFPIQPGSGSIKLAQVCGGLWTRSGTAWNHNSSPRIFNHEPDLNLSEVTPTTVAYTMAGAAVPLSPAGQDEYGIYVAICIYTPGFGRDLRIISNGTIVIPDPLSSSVPAIVYNYRRRRA